MTQRAPLEQYDHQALEDYRRQARDFLSKAHEYLAIDDLHQASEKGWGAAAWMAKAVAEVRGWEYREHPQFGNVIYNASVLTGNDRLRLLGGSANDLHRNFYTRKRFLLSEAITRSLDDMTELLNALEPLTKQDNGI